MSKTRIAFSLCGEGYGHYGRCAGVIKGLSERLPDAIIDVYCYAHSYEIISKDHELPPNVLIHKIPGFTFKHSKDSKIDLLGTLTGKDNWLVSLEIVKLALLRYIVDPLISIFSKQNSLAYNMTHDYFEEFDVAISDFEALLPRAARLRKKELITLNNLHIMLYGRFDLKQYSLKEMFKFLANKFFLKIYHPVPDKFLLTTIYDYPIRPWYSKKVQQIRPLVRNDIVKRRKQAVRKDFVLVYVRSILKDKILPIISQIEGTKFVAFVDDLTEEERKLYGRSWIEFREISPARFIDCLLTCKAVISTSGFTLITESLILKKPYFAIAIGGILGLEQKLNLNILKSIHCGSGCKVNELNRERVERFLEKADYYADKAAEYDLHDSTEEVIELVMEKLNTSLARKRRGL